jgi:hypothetical protein
MPRAPKQKDPNAPKRPLSAFFIFSQDERPKIKLTNAALSVADVAKVIGEKWRSAPDDLKRRYEKSAKEAKERYEIELQAYKKTGNIVTLSLSLSFYLDSDLFPSRICPINATASPQSSTSLKNKERQAISFIENEHSFNHIHISTLLSVIVLSFSVSVSVSLSRIRFCSITSLVVLFLRISILSDKRFGLCCTDKPHKHEHAESPFPLEKKMSILLQLFSWYGCSYFILYACCRCRCRSAIHVEVFS